MMSKTLWLAACVAIFQLAPLISAQETVEGRLLKTLRDKGVITADEYRDLCDLEAKIRAEDDLSAQIETGIEELVARLDDAKPRSSYKIGRGFTWETADNRFKLTLGGRLQVRFTYDLYSMNEKTGGEDEPDFDVPRARIWVRGHVFEPFLKYKFQFDILGDEADTTVTFNNGTTAKFSSTNRLAELKDAYFDFTKWSALSIRGGQFKAPYSRHWLTSSGNQQFVDRAITNRTFAPGRGVGLMAHGKTGGEKNDLFEYYAGVFDGEGENKTNNDEGLMWAGRVAINPLGPVKYSESDLKGRDEFRFAVGLNAWLHQDDNHMSGGDDYSIGADVVATWRGLFFTGELHYRENDVSGGSDIEILGWMTQLGYFIIPNEFEVAVRAANIDWDNNGAKDSAMREYLVVLSYFWEEHNMKVQADFGRIEDHEGDPSDNIDEWRMRFQLQIIF